MATQDQVKIAIVGAGLIGPRHAQSVVKCCGATLTCFVDPSPGAQAIARSFDVPIFKDISGMLQAADVPDAAIVCTPNHTHVALSQELLEAGLHVLVEKPVSTDIASGQALLRTATLSGKQLLAGHHRRFNPYVTAVKRTLDNAAIGQPIAVSGIWALYKPRSYYEPPADWRAGSTGGPILINLSHEIDILQYLLGPITRVHAEQTVSHRGHEAEEGAAVLLRFASGVVGTFLLSDATPSAHNFESGTGENPIIPKAGRDFYRIFGTEGTLSVGDMKVTRHSAGEKSWTSKLQETDVKLGKEVPLDAQVEHFVRVVRGEEVPRCSGEDGLRAVVVCSAIKEAMASGTPVDIRTSKL